MTQQRTQAAGDRQAKVIPIRLDASFFFERAVQSLDRFRYDRALKYFRRAVEFEPDNPVNHCNMAGILSEMGRYEESNSILRVILERIDPGMTECYYYLANNYANMERYEDAEEALIRYLETDPDGHYLEEADELLELLHYELNRPPRINTIKCRENLFAHDKARGLLEAGRFSEAVRILEEILERQPDFAAARNNLALAYYYMGYLEKAMQLTAQVLEADAGNLHALCNLAIFFRHKGREEDLQELVSRLKRIVPMHPEHALKLATTMGIVGEHAVAHRLFSRLLRYGDWSEEPSLLHFAAVAAANVGAFDDAEKHWRAAQRLDPRSPVPAYYLGRLTDMREGREPPPDHYHYHLPVEEQFRRWERDPAQLSRAIREDPLVRSSFFWALRGGDRQTKIQVIQALGLAADEEVVEALKAFLVDPGEDNDLKRIAVLVLRSIGVEDKLQVVFSGRPLTLEAKRRPARLPFWDNAWQNVLDRALEGMADRYDMVEQHDMMTLWVDFLARVYPQVPKVNKPAAWAAALEYWVARMHRKPVAYADLASRYDVSQASLSRCVNRIDEACGIREKLKWTTGVFWPNPPLSHEDGYPRM
jgi:tetratricopeptide (TPR) repeat protein